MVVVIIFLAAPGRLFFLAFLVKIYFLLITNILFGIFTLLIRIYYVCSYRIDKTIKRLAVS